MSREEALWQNELKDVIWLELQAYHAERTPMEEDSYLCSEREIVDPLLNDIKNYRFQRNSRRYVKYIVTLLLDSTFPLNYVNCLQYH